MASMESFMFMAALIALGLSAIFYLWHSWKIRRLGSSSSKVASSPQEAPVEPGVWNPGKFAIMMAVSGLIFLTLSIIARWVVTGHGPFSNMYEFSTAFTWGIMVIFIYFERRLCIKSLGAIVVPLALGMILYAYFLPSRALPLIPALQNSLLLTIHVAVAVIAYGSFTISFGAAFIYLVQHNRRIPWLPSPAIADDLGYQAVVIGFPFMTLTILLGALWADMAWGRYWAWDPKETASLATWLIYGGYLHARLIAGWRGGRSALLLLIGFVAVLFTYFGNYFLGGLHSYG